MRATSRKSLLRFLKFPFNLLSSCAHRVVPVLFPFVNQVLARKSRVLLLSLFILHLRLSCSIVKVFFGQMACRCKPDMLDCFLTKPKCSCSVVWPTWVGHHLPHVTHEITLEAFRRLKKFQTKRLKRKVVFEQSFKKFQTAYHC